jgi:hypothetical protein
MPQHSSGARFEDRLATLRAATSVELGPVGVAAHKTEGYLAYDALAGDLALLRSRRADIEALSRDARPGGLIYGALLLGKLDRDAAATALAALVDRTEPLPYAAGGCAIGLPGVGRDSTLGDVARHLLPPLPFSAPPDLRPKHGSIWLAMAACLAFWLIGYALWRLILR